MAEFKYPPQGTAAGTVIGPGSSTDNAVARFNGTTGESIQNSPVILDDSGNLSGVGSLDMSGAIDGATTGTFTGEITSFEGTTREIALNETVLLQSSTGVDAFDGLTSQTTTFTIGAGSGLIVDPDLLTFTHVNWSSSASHAPATANGVTYVYMQADGTPLITTTTPTPSSVREHIFLGRMATTSGNIGSITSQVVPLCFPNNVVYDLAQGLGVFTVEGCDVTANASANLTIDREAGTLYQFGVNFVTDSTNPSYLAIAAATPVSTAKLTSTTIVSGPTANIDPVNYDVGGTVTSIPGSANVATIQRVYQFTSGLMAVQYGPVVYSNLNNAIQAVSTEAFVPHPGIQGNGVLVASICLTKGCTNLTDTTTARIFAADRFGEAGAGVSGTSVSTLQNAYNNSVEPEITTDSTRGAVTIKRGSAADTDLVLELENGAGTPTFTVNGNGDVVIAGDLTVNGTTTTINTANMNVEDKNIRINYGGTNATAAGAGITVEGTGAADLATLQYDTALASKFKIGAAGSEKEVVTVGDTQTLTGKTLTDAIITQQASDPAYAEGKVWYDSVDDVLRYYNDSTVDSVAVGREINVKIRNVSGSTLTAGQVVRITGAVAGVPSVVLAQANTFANAKVFAVVTESILNNTNGYGTISGIIKNLNLSAFADGDVLFLSPSVAGGLTTTRPTSPNYAMPIGTVASNHASTGRLIVQMAAGRSQGYGTANQLLGMNSGATEQEYKTLNGTTGQINVNHAANSITLSLDAAALTTSGALNIVDNPSAATNTTGWTAATNYTVTRNTSNSPLAGIIDTAFAISTTTASSETSTSGVYAAALACPPALRNSKLQVSLHLTVPATADGVWCLSIYNASGTRMNLASDSSSVTTLAGGYTGQFQTSFDADSSATYTVSLTQTSRTNSNTLYVTNITVGSFNVTQVPALSNETTFTPTTQGFGTLASHQMQYRQVGSKQHISGRFIVGTPTAVEARINLPYGTVAQINGSSLPYFVGRWTRNNGNASVRKTGVVIATPGNTYLTFGSDDYTAALSSFSNLNGNVMLDAGDAVSFNGELTIPIAEWAGSVSTGPVPAEEFVTNSSTTVTSDTSSFVSGGAAGTQLPNGAAANSFSKRVQFQYPIQQDDEITIEVQDGAGAPWLDVSKTMNSTGIGTLGYYGVQSHGIGWSPVSSSSTQIDIVFGKYAFNANTTFGAAGTDWSGVSTSVRKWRVRKTKKASLPYANAGTDGSAGLVAPYNSSSIVHSARYTPAIAASTNVTTVTNYSAHYTRVGKVVTVSGFFTCATTAGSTASPTASTLYIPLPINSNLSAFEDAAGTFVKSTATGTASAVGYIGADTTPGNNRVLVSFNATNTGVSNCTYQFQYEIK